MAIARALMARPAGLLLDEPSMGLAPILVAQIMDVIRNSKTLGIMVLLVEQNACAALGIADRGYVMETGRMTIPGPPECSRDLHLMRLPAPSKLNMKIEFTAP